MPVATLTRGTGRQMRPPVINDHHQARLISVPASKRLTFAAQGWSGRAGWRGKAKILTGGYGNCCYLHCIACKWGALLALLRWSGGLLSYRACRASLATGGLHVSAKRRAEAVEQNSFVVCMPESWRDTHYLVRWAWCNCKLRPGWWESCVSNPQTMTTANCQSKQAGGVVPVQIWLS